MPDIKHGFLRSEEGVRPEEAMFDNWQKLVSSNKNDLVHEKITYYILMVSVLGCTHEISQTPHVAYGDVPLQSART